MDYLIILAMIVIVSYPCMYDNERIYSTEKKKLIQLSIIIAIYTIIFMFAKFIILK